MIAALTGTNWFALKQALDEHIGSFRKTYGDLAVERIQAPETAASNITGSVGGLSLFSDAKMVIITDLSVHKEASEILSQLIASADENSNVIVVDPLVDKRSAYYKALKKLNNFKEFNELSEESLIRWAVEYVKQGGGEISPADSRYLIERVGANQTHVERELSKLVLYDKKITRSTIDELTVAVPSSTIFQLVESAFNGNVKAALKLYEEQRALRKEPQAIYGMLVWQMHIVAVCAAAGSKSTAEIAAETGMKSYSLGKAKDIARKMGAAKVQEFLKLLRDIELTAKSQTYDFDEALKYAITSLAY